jgi:hypothetical protein
MRLQISQISIGMPNFGMPNFDSVNFCTLGFDRLTVVQKLTESKFGIPKFGIPIEIWSLMSPGIGCTKYRRLPISTSVMSYTGTGKIQKITVIYDKIQTSLTDNIQIFGAKFFGTEYLFFQIQICFCTIVLCI